MVWKVSQDPCCWPLICLLVINWKPVQVGRQGKKAGKKRKGKRRMVEKRTNLNYRMFPASCRKTNFTPQNNSFLFIMWAIPATLCLRLLVLTLFPEAIIVPSKKCQPPQKTWQESGPVKSRVPHRPTASRFGQCCQCQRVHDRLRLRALKSHSSFSSYQTHPQIWTQTLEMFLRK